MAGAMPHRRIMTYLKIPTTQMTVSIGVRAADIVESYARFKGISRSWASYQVFEASPLLDIWAAEMEAAKVEAAKAEVVEESLTE